MRGLWGKNVWRKGERLANGVGNKWPDWDFFLHFPFGITEYQTFFSLEVMGSFWRGFHMYKYLFNLAFEDHFRLRALLDWDL